MTAAIFTIGYGSRSIEDFLEILHQFGINVLIDTRSSPYSRFRPAYRKKTLQDALARAGIQYEYLGDQLGGRPADPDCYTGGQVDYLKLQQQSFYQAGITRLRQIMEAGPQLCLMCAEARPQECHRALLLGETLAAQGIEVIHIDEHDLPQPHLVIVPRLAKDTQPRLF